MVSLLARLNPVPALAAGTRRLQAAQPERPVRGLTRFAALIDRWLPRYQGVIRLPGGGRMIVDSRDPAQRWLLFSGSYQPAVTHALRAYTPRGGWCLDVGANLGYYTVALASWAGPQGRVAAFEANPAMAAQVRRNVALNPPLDGFAPVEIVEQPVDRRAGPVTFFVSASPGKSSLIAGHVSAPVERLALAATTLDDYLSAQSWPRLDAVKIDIEGNDCNAVLGAQASLDRFRPVIVFEYGFDTPREVAAETFALLDRLGYTCQTLERQGRRSPFDWQLSAAQTHDAAHVDVLALPGVSQVSAKG